jgi:hypothetical protein
VINAYQVAGLALLLPLAALVTGSATAGFYLVGMTVFTLGSVACAVADSLFAGAGACGSGRRCCWAHMSVNAAMGGYPRARCWAVALPPIPWWWPSRPLLARRLRQYLVCCVPGRGYSR